MVVTVFLYGCSMVVSIWLFYGCFYMAVSMAVSIWVFRSMLVFYLFCLLAFIPLLNNSSPIQSTVFHVLRFHPSSPLPPPLTIPSAVHHSIRLPFSLPRHIPLPPSVPLSVTPYCFILPSVHSFPSHPLILPQSSVSDPPSVLPSVLLPEFPLPFCLRDLLSRALLNNRRYIMSICDKSSCTMPDHPSRSSLMIITLNHYL